MMMKDYSKVLDYEIKFMILITVLTHIVTVFSVARSQKNFCSMGKILGDTKIFFQSIRSICYS